MSTQGYADAGGVAIHFTDHQGDGPPLVLVHATGFHAHIWDPFLPELTPRFRVVTLDQRGHGESDKPATGYHWDRFGEDVLAVVSHLGLDRPLGAGHSAGAAALILAEGHRSGTFSRLVLMDPVTPAPDLRPVMTGDANPMVASTRKRRGVWDSREQMLERMRTNSPFARWREDFLRAYVEHGTQPLPDGRFELRCPPEIEAQIYQNNGTHRGWELLTEIDCTALLVFGEHSPMWPADRQEACVSRMLNGERAVADGAGHFVPMEAPDRSLELMLGFLRASPVG